MFRFLFGVVVGAAVGGGGMLVAFPFIFPPAEVNETLQVARAEEVRLAATGRFAEDAPGQDAAHWGRGTLRLYDMPGDTLALEIQPDFKVGPGPNFWVYLNSVPGIVDIPSFKADAGRVKVAKLKSFSGSQVYEIERSDYESAESVTIWCETFGQYITSADLVRET